MADNIKGLTVEFSASTSKFKKQMRDFDKDLKQTRKESNLLAESLKLEWNPEKFKQAQEAARKAIVKTSEKAVVLQARLKHMEEKGLSTDKQRQEFQKLQTELSYTENSLIKLNREMEKLNEIKLNNLKKQFDVASKSLTDLGKTMLPVSATAGAMVAGITAVTKKTIQYADDVATLAEQLGVTCEQMQRLQYIAMQTDVSNERLTKGFVKLRTAVGETLLGQTNKATESLQVLGYSINDLNKMTQEEIFADVISRLGEIEDSTLQATYANHIFGEKIATDLIPLIKTGGETLAKLNAEFETSGYLSEEQIGKLAEFDNVINRLKTSFANAARQIGEAFLPVFQKIGEMIEKRIVPAIQKMAVWFNNLSVGQKELILGLGTIVAALAPMLLISGKLVSSFGQMLPLLKRMGGAFYSLLGPVGIILGILALLYATNEDFRKSINEIVGELGKVLASVLKLVGNLFKMIMSLIKPFADLLVAVLIPALDGLMIVLQPIFDILTAIIDAISWVFKQVGKLGSWIGRTLGISKKEQKAMAETASPQKAQAAIAENEAVRSISNNDQYFSNYTDNSQKTFTVNLTINNYGAELDYNDVVKQINRRLAEQY